MGEQQRAAEAQRHAESARTVLATPPPAHAWPPAQPSLQTVEPQAILPQLPPLAPVAAAPLPSEPEINPAVLTRSIQKELLRVGCNPGPEDGIWGIGARSALDQFARLTQATLKTDAPSPEALAALTGRRDRVCPLKCGDDEQAVGGRCVPKPVVAQPQPKPAPKAAPPPVAKIEPQEKPRPQPPRQRDTASVNSGGGGGGRRCNGFPRPRQGESCIGAGGRTCVAGGGAGSCN